jgi:PAS domain S-box-containing protein
MDETTDNGNHKVRIQDERIQIAVEAARIGIWDFNLLTGKIICNAITREQLGVPEDFELNIDTYPKLIHPDDREMAYAAFIESIDPESSRQYDISYRIYNPPLVPSRWLRSAGKIFFDKDDNPYRFIGSSVDITEQKTIEEALRQSNEQFIHLADSLPQIVWKAKSDGVADFFNQQWYNFTGFKNETKISDWALIIHPDDYNLCNDSWSESVRTGKLFEIEYRFKDRKTGTYRWFLGRAYPIKDEMGNVKEWFGTCTDIHDQKMMMEDLEKRVEGRTKELMQMNNRLARVNRDMERKNKELEQLAWIASHDLKEPLRKIRTYMSALEDHLKTLDAVSQNYLGKMQASAIRMNQLITDILNFSQLSMLEDSFEEINLNVVMQDVVKDQETVIVQKKAKVIWSNLPSIYGLRIQLYQLFYNLVNNSLKFSKADVPPVIEISSKPLTKREAAFIKQLDQKIAYHRITVADNGIGFDEQYATKVFDIFQRLHAKSEYEGTGIGLSLCKKIAHNHHGELLARSRQGAGTKMIVILPQILSQTLNA